jgi:hypothetical protein
MHADSSRADEARPLITRRRWLAGALWTCAGTAIRAKAGAEDGPVAENDEDAECQAVEALGERLGLRSFRTTRTRHFLGIGDTSDAFRGLTLRDCELTAADFMDHYRSKGFDVDFPAQRLTVVVLADARSFLSVLKGEQIQLPKGREFVPPALRGVYNPVTNRLVVFDQFSLGPIWGVRAGHQNLRVVAHETTHQLTFNTGLLRRKCDVPRSIMEGLAVYGEIRKTIGRTAPGQINRGRLADLLTLRRTPWIPLQTLLSDDRYLQGGDSDQSLVLAYAESWILVHYLMSDPTRTASFRRYLEATRNRTAAHPDARLDDARQHLGDLNRLDKDLWRYAIRLNEPA